MSAQLGISVAGTMDFNGHMANTAYLDLAADVRMAFFAEHGFPPAEFVAAAAIPHMRLSDIPMEFSSLGPLAFYALDVGRTSLRAKEFRRLLCRSELSRVASHRAWSR